MARSQGVEVTLALRPVDALQVQANYSHVESEDRSPGATFGKDLVRRPRDTASAIVDYRWSFGLQTGATFTHSGSSFDNAANTRRVEGYDVVDLRVSYPMTAKLDLQARVENVFDKEYETIYRYGMPGRAAFVGARMSY
jgi:vitamin B12 transporter